MLRISNGPLRRCQSPEPSVAGGISHKHVDRCLSHLSHLILEVVSNHAACKLVGTRERIWDFPFLRLPHCLTTHVDPVKANSVSARGQRMCDHTYNRPFFAPTFFKSPSTSNPHDSIHSFNHASHSLSSSFIFSLAPVLAPRLP